MFVKFSCEWIDFGAKLLNEALPHLCVRLKTIVKKKPSGYKLLSGRKRRAGSMSHFVKSVSVCNIVLISFDFSNCRILCFVI